MSKCLPEPDPERMKRLDPPRRSKHQSERKWKRPIRTTVAERRRRPRSTRCYSSPCRPLRVAAVRYTAADAPVPADAARRGKRPIALAMGGDQ